MRNSLPVLVLLLFLHTCGSLFQCAEAQSTASGEWRVAFASRNLNATFVLNQEGTNLEGTWTIDGSTPQSLEGTITGDSLFLVGKKREQNGKLLISTFSARVAADKMNGHLSFQWEEGDAVGPPQPWSAERIISTKKSANDQESGLNGLREDQEIKSNQTNRDTQPVPPSSMTGLAEKLHSTVARYESYGFSGVVLVSKDGIPVLNEGYGVANQAQGLKNDPYIYYDLASITKQFTSAAILLLQEKGKLSTNDPLVKYFPAVPPNKANITIQQLLNHTSGITKVPRELYYQVDRTDLVDAIFDVPLRLPPGESFDYENENYNLLASIIERISEQPYESFLSKHFFEPLGIADISFESESVSNALAVQYVGQLDSTEAIPIREGAFRQGAGGAKATTIGLHQWMRALIAGEILNEETLTELLVWRDAAQASYHNAWSHRTTAFGSHVIEIAGDLEGFQHQLQYYPAEDLVVIILSNTRVNGFQWRERIADDVGRVATGYPSVMPIARDNSTQEKNVITGEYVSESGDQLIIEPVGTETLRISGSGQDIVDFFSFMDTERRPLINELNDRLLNASAELVKGETADFESLIAEGAIERFQRDWHELKNTAGDLIDYQLLGSIPNGPTRFTTLMKYAFDRGPVLTIRFYWGRNNENLVGWWAKPYEPAMMHWFYATGPNTWASFDPLMEEQVILTNSVNNNELLLSLPTQTITASLKQR